MYFGLPNELLLQEGTKLSTHLASGKWQSYFWCGLVAPVRSVKGHQITTFISKKHWTLAETKENTAII